ncbi:hypothetical protein [Streptomyces sp. WAC 04229]|uniref:hypothetical protein n=1 Tax=Streptomyces sp. WAC 04229 TaxID=2203206 RepID=UPI003D749C95
MREPFTAAISALAVSALALTGCSHQSSDERGQEGATEAASEVCQRVEMAARNQLIAMALAIGGEEKSGSMVQADGKLRPALTKWATASTAVARYVAEQKPRAGLVINFGPTEKQWDGAQKTAEKMCGQGLPALDRRRVSARV